MKDSTFCILTTGMMIGAVGALIVFVGGLGMGLSIDAEKYCDPNSTHPDLHTKNTNRAYCVNEVGAEIDAFTKTNDTLFQVGFWILVAGCGVVATGGSILLASLLNEKCKKPKSCFGFMRNRTIHDDFAREGRDTNQDLVSRSVTI